MKRTPKHVEISVHGALGYGYTPKEARAHAISRIETAFTDAISGYHPVMIRFPKGDIGLMYRDLEGWQYSILWSQDDDKRCYGSGQHYDNAKQAEVHLRRHMAQQYIFASDDNGMSILDPFDTEGQKDHAKYVKFQLAYKEYQTQGKTAQDCHRLACEASYSV